MTEEQFRELIREPIAETKRLVIDDMAKLLAQTRKRTTNGAARKPGPFLSLRQAAREFGVAERLMREAVPDELPAYKLGKRTLRVEWSAVDLWVRSRQVKPWRPK